MTGQQIHLNILQVLKARRQGSGADPDYNTLLLGMEEERLLIQLAKDSRVEAEHGIYIETTIPPRLLQWCHLQVRVCLISGWIVCHV